jgi:hypothetical protein
VGKLGIKVGAKPNLSPPLAKASLAKHPLVANVTVIRETYVFCIIVFINVNLKRLLYKKKLRLRTPELG